MRFEWDRQKAASNLRKHGVDFADAVMVFYNELAVTVRDDTPEEERFISECRIGVGVGIGIGVEKSR